MTDEGTAQEEERYARSSDEWVREFALRHYERDFPRHRWCHTWSSHPEATFVFDALWKSFEEALVADSSGAGGQNIMNYLVGHFYPMMDRLTGPNGPFERCGLSFCGGSTQLTEAGSS